MPIWVQHGDPSLGAGLALSGGLLGGLAEAQQRDQAMQMAQAHAQLAHQNRLDEIDRTSSDTLNREVGLERYKTDAARGSASDVIGGLQLPPETAQNPELLTAINMYGRTGHAPPGLWSGLSTLGGMMRQKSGTLLPNEATARTRVDQQASEAADRSNMGWSGLLQRAPLVNAQTAKANADTAAIQRRANDPFHGSTPSSMEKAVYGVVRSAEPAEVGKLFAEPDSLARTGERLGAVAAQGHATNQLLSYAGDESVPLGERLNRIEALAGHIPEPTRLRMRAMVQTERRSVIAGLEPHQRDAAQAQMMAETHDRVRAAVSAQAEYAKGPFGVNPGMTAQQARETMRRVLAQDGVSEDDYRRYISNLKP